MEKDIKVIETYIKEREYKLKTRQEILFKQAIENLINRVKELEEIEEEHRKENGKLKEELKEIKKEYSAEQKHEMKNTIPKSKIKEKIKELENFEPEEYAPLVIKEEQLNNVKWQIQVLQELLK